MSFDMKSPRMVLGGTLFGEVRGYGRAPAENIAQVILDRVAQKWDAGGIVGVCLAHAQFSCWNPGDPNRAKILAAPTTTNVEERGAWALCLSVADAAIGGTLPNRVMHADSYYARTSARPYWANPPAVKTYEDTAHDFWRTKAATRGAPAKSVHSPVTSPPVAANTETDALNLAQLQEPQA